MNCGLRFLLPLRAPVSLRQGFPDWLSVQVGGNCGANNDLNGTIQVGKPRDADPRNVSAKSNIQACSRVCSRPFSFHASVPEALISECFEIEGIRTVSEKKCAAALAWARPQIRLQVAHKNKKAGCLDPAFNPRIGCGGWI